MAGTRTDIFWCKVFFKAFIKHFRKMTDEEIVKDIRQSMDDLEDLVEDTDTFGAQMVRWANHRPEQYPMARENGKKGGRPRKIVKDESEQRVGGNSGNGLVTAPAEPIHKAAAPSTRIAPAEPEVLSLAYSGEFANVRLTQEQYNDLLQHVGNMNDCKSLIDDFSASIADGSTKSDNHFATLKKWAKARKRFDSEKKEGAPTFQEREGKRQSEQLRKYGLMK